MSPVTIVTYTPAEGLPVSARGRFLRDDGTMDMERLRAALELPESVDLGDLNFRVPRAESVTVTTHAWTLSVELPT
ncbi:MAG: hypothetical protein KDB26_12405 [Microthrixaceae bacterium]|nr:hypothetical protein [Microthrixaceae bacterium]